MWFQKDLRLRYLVEVLLLICFLASNDLNYWNEGIL